MGLVWVSQQVQWKARPKEGDSQDRIWAGVWGKPQYGGGEEANSGLGDWETDEGKRLVEAGGPSPSRGASRDGGMGRDRGVAEPAGWRSGSRAEGDICSWGFGAGDCYREGGQRPVQLNTEVMLNDGGETKLCGRMQSSESHGAL